MAGVCFVICKKSEIEKTANYPSRSFYLNLYQQYKYSEEHGEMQFTPPVQVIYALRQALKEFFEEGQKGRFERYKDNFAVLKRGLKDLGFKSLLKEECQSHILTTIIEPKHPNYDFTLMHDILYEKGFTIYPGKIGETKSFRVANMGAIDNGDIDAFFVACKEALSNMQIKTPL